MDVLNFSRRPRREFKPVPISSHSAYQIEMEAMKPIYSRGHYLILPFSSCPRRWATLEIFWDKVTRMFRVQLYRWTFIIAKNFNHFEFLTVPINSSRWISNFSVFRKLVLIFVRNRDGAVILDTKLFVFRAWKLVSRKNWSIRNDNCNLPYSFLREYYIFLNYFRRFFDYP